MAAEWFYQAKGQQWGPVLSAELRRLADTGILTPDTLVCRATATGMADGRWVRTRRSRGFFNLRLHPRRCLRAFRWFSRTVQDG